MSNELTNNQIVITVAGAPKTGKSTILYVIFDALRAAGFTDVLVDTPDLFRHGFYRQQANRVRYLAENVRRPITIAEIGIRRSEDPLAARRGQRLELPVMPETEVSDVIIDMTPKQLVDDEKNHDHQLGPSGEQNANELAGSDFGRALPDVSATDQLGVSAHTPVVRDGAEDGCDDDR